MSVTTMRMTTEGGGISVVSLRDCRSFDVVWYWSWTSSGRGRRIDDVIHHRVDVDGWTTTAPLNVEGDNKDDDCNGAVDNPMANRIRDPEGLRLVCTVQAGGGIHHAPPVHPRGQ
jgi:hypothetical protein